MVCIIDPSIDTRGSEYETTSGSESHSICLVDTAIFSRSGREEIHRIVPSPLIVISEEVGGRINNS